MNEIVKTAREYLGTPFHHQARLKGHGVDCIGLVICVAKDVGLLDKDWDVTGYSRYPDGKQLMHHLTENLIQVSQSDMQPGQIVCVAFNKYPQHVGIVGDYLHGGLSIIHADAVRGKVLETRLLFTDSMKFVSAFKFKEK